MILPLSNGWMAPATREDGRMENEKGITIAVFDERL
jgi:hypothetical protein